tara:strand:- start:157 stop:363 length:207 start_codon:yes stop_codon:yes gene_type:complete
MKKSDAQNILSCLSRKLNGYESTSWLKAPNEKLGGKSPAELMMDGQAKSVEKILDEEMKRIKSKKNNG